MAHLVSDHAEVHLPVGDQIDGGNGIGLFKMDADVLPVGAAVQKISEGGGDVAGTGDGHTHFQSRGGAGTVEGFQLV